MPSLDPGRNLLAIGQLAERSGTSVSALRFYEQNGLIASERTAGNQRRYRRDVLRRIAFIRTSQRVGISLAEIRAALESLPDARTPTRADWVRISARWRRELDARIADLQHLRSELDGCIGCGCLSLATCGLRNPGDVLGETGRGAVRWDSASHPDADEE
ncbi:redox-sensitive transcriptional activator SoxR [Herbiconiux sp.]|jgi:MerR family redox-sensitive transcriptional activator SoxR|uniref:redox-sensitive transcriptional activator SoxR n=1 Tax=Herbiconiux sp. TaxID=1871186 RepID=UPI0025B7BCB5|nr:redox-sensitive transcriptional activator SoxR [Herbiconiux sp.]